MGLPNRTNPAATPQTVLQSASVGAVVFAILYALYVAVSHAWSDSPTPWTFGVAIPWALSGAVIFGLMDWQPPDMPSVGDVAPYCEREFAIKLAPERFLPVEEVSVNDLYREVLEAIRLQHPDDQADEAEVWARLRDLIVNRLGVDEDEVTPQARFMYELA